MSTRTRVVVGFLVGLAVPLAWWAVPGGRDPGDLTQTLLVALVTGALVAVLGLLRHRVREGSVVAGHALRDRRDDRAEGPGTP